MIEKLFDLQGSGTTVRREVVAGCTTFMTLSYIIFVQPAILSVTGMDSGAVMTATCISSALAMILMAFLANYPFALAPTFLKLQLNIFAEPKLLMAVAVFFFLDLFDTVGTLVGVGQQSGLMVDGKLPKARQALLFDAVATSTGALLGTSTVTTYIESASGISAGGRTGLTNIVTALLMLLALFFHPLIKTVGAGYPIGENVFLYPVIAPALIIVGSMMLRNVTYIDWDDVTESIPAFLTMLMMPLTFSITEGIAFGFISYTLLKLVKGKGRQIHWLIYFFAVLFIGRYIWLVG